MLAYGLLLQLAINRQLVRKAFKADNASADMNCSFDQVRDCLRCERSYLAANSTGLGLQPSNGTFMSVGEQEDNRTNTTSEDFETQEFQDVNICHPQPDLSRDASRMLFFAWALE